MVVTGHLALAVMVTTGDSIEKQLEQNMKMRCHLVVANYQAFHTFGEAFIDRLVLFENRLQDFSNARLYQIAEMLIFVLRVLCNMNTVVADLFSPCRSQTLFFFFFLMESCWLSSGAMPVLLNKKDIILTLGENLNVCVYVCEIWDKEREWALIAHSCYSGERFELPAESLIMMNKCRRKRGRW